MRTYFDLSEEDKVNLANQAKDLLKHDRTLSHSSESLDLDYEGIIKLIDEFNIIEDYKSRYIAKRTLRRKINCLKEYGVESPLALPEIRNAGNDKRWSKSAREKREKTCQERYGGKTPLSKGTTSRCKYEKTMMDRYGVSNAFCAGELRDQTNQKFLETYGMTVAQYGALKGTETTRERYGVDYYFQCPDANKKILEGIRSRGFGGPNSVHFGEETAKIISSRENLEKFILSVDEKQRFRSTLAELLGMSTSQFNYYLRTYELRHLLRKNGGMSQPEMILGDIIEGWGVQVVRRTRKIISPYEIDIYLPDYKVGIEYNGGYWHQNREEYHEMKSSLCSEVGVTLIHVSEKDYYENLDSVIVNIFELLGLDKKYSLVLSNQSIHDDKLRDFMDIEVDSDLHNFTTNIGVVHNSVDTRQILQLQGYNTGYTSLDRTPDGYDALRSAINDQRIILLQGCPTLINELTELERDNMTRRYDHPVSSTKDIADGLAGSFLDASKYKDEYMFFDSGGYDYEGINHTEDPVEDFRNQLTSELVGKLSDTKLKDLFINDDGEDHYYPGDDNILIL